MTRVSSPEGLEHRTHSLLKTREAVTRQACLKGSGVLYAIANRSRV